MINTYKQLLDLKNVSRELMADLDDQVIVSRVSGIEFKGATPFNDKQLFNVMLPAHRVLTKSKSLALIITDVLEMIVLSVNSGSKLTDSFSEVAANNTHAFNYIYKTLATIGEVGIPHTDLSLTGEAERASNMLDSVNVEFSSHAADELNETPIQLDGMHRQILDLNILLLTDILDLIAFRGSLNYGLDGVLEAIKDAEGEDEYREFIEVVTSIKVLIEHMIKEYTGLCSSVNNIYLLFYMNNE